MNGNHCISQKRTLYKRLKERTPDEDIAKEEAIDGIIVRKRHVKTREYKCARIKK